MRGSSNSGRRISCSIASRVIGPRTESNVIESQRPGIWRMESDGIHLFVKNNTLTHQRVPIG